VSLLPRRLRSLWRSGDQSASDADQTSSEADQTSSDADQTLSDRDRAAALSDQRVSDREQELADRQLDAGGATERAVQLPEYERAHAERDEGTMARTATAAVRTMISTERDAQAERRDESARNRDRIAGERDQVADLADEEAETLAHEVGEIEPAVKAALEAAAAARAHAASARVKAAADRDRAARDREAAARDRELLRTELERSQLDELTGAFRRGLGEILLRHEMSRANRAGGPLTLVFVDADGLKETNTRSGHAAGDALLRSIFGALQANVRPYDPIVRWGGDEFVCTIAGVSLAEARRRIERARSDLDGQSPAVSVTFGLAAMRPDDTLAALVGRADAEERKAKEENDA